MTNEEKLRETFPKTIFIFQKNGNDETTAIMCSDEWLQRDYDQMYKDSAPCEDVVSREAVETYVKEYGEKHGCNWIDNSVLYKFLRNLPSVQPTSTPCEYAEDCKKMKFEPCEDAVSRQAVLDAITANCIWENEYNLTSSRIKNAVEKLPPVTPKQRTGKWMKTGQSFINPNRFRNYCCSECGWELDEHIRIEPHYCPNCGVKMKGESE